MSRYPIELDLTQLGSHVRQLPLLLRSRLCRSKPLYIPGGAEAATDPLASWDSWCAAHKGHAVRGLLSGHHTHQMLLTRAENPEDARQQARQLWAPYFSAQVEEWPMATWLETHSNGVCALHGIAMHDWRATARRHAVHLSGLQPWWAWALRWASQRSQLIAKGRDVALGVVEPGLLTWLRCDDSQLVGLQQRRFGEWAPLTMRVQQLLGEQSAPGGVWLMGHGLSTHMRAELAAQPWKQMNPLDALTVAPLLEGN